MHVLLRPLNIDRNVEEIANGDLVARLGAKIDYDSSSLTVAMLGCAVHCEFAHAHVNIYRIC